MSKEVLLLSSKMVRKNKALKDVKKISKLVYGDEKGFVRSKIGKVVMCDTTLCLRKDDYSFEAETDFKTVIEKCKETGLTGLSGNGFEVYKKLEAFAKIDAGYRCIIVNGAECEPGLVHDQWFLDTDFVKVIKAASNFAHIAGVDNVVIAAKTFPSDISNLPENVRLKKVPAKYPYGEERILLKQILGVDIEKKENPAEKGYLVINLQTLMQIMTIAAGKKIDGRYVTLADLDNGFAASVYVKYGENVIEKLHKLFGERAHAYAGAGIMSASEAAPDTTFSPTTCFAAVATTIPAGNTENACKGCGRCKKACPKGVDLKKFVKSYEADKDGDFSSFGLEKCIGCKICSFVCAANKCPQELVKAINSRK